MEWTCGFPTSYIAVAQRAAWPIVPLSRSLKKVQHLNRLSVVPAHVLVLGYAVLLKVSCMDFVFGGDYYLTPSVGGPPISDTAFLFCRDSDCSCVH